MWRAARRIAAATRDAADAAGRAHPGEAAPAVRLEGVGIAFDDNVVLDDVSFTVAPGRMKIVVGASGSGKSVLLKLLLGLLKPDTGGIWIGGRRIDQLDEPALMPIRAGIGMLFQETALFDSLTVAENVGYRLYEETDMPADDVRRRVEDVLGFIGLAEYIDRMPSELSGGQRRRVGLARAFAAKPGLLLIDEPTSGLDPITAKTVDHEILKLRDLEDVTIVAVTHQLRDAFYMATHRAVREGGAVVMRPWSERDGPQPEFLMLRNGVVHFDGTVAEFRASSDPYVKRFLI
jgi:phospholipid/cholesterol/gamma-HCH transport system ATP-binding protein